MAQIVTGKKLQANYDGYYETEDPEWRRLGAVDKAANIAELCAREPHASILDIGAGDGAILRRLADLHFGNAYHAVEISSSAVDVLRGRQIPGLADARLFDGYSLPYESDVFDLAVLSHVVEHVEHPRQLLYEAARVAKRIFVEVPLEDISRKRGDFAFDRVGHINFYSERTIRWLLQSSGLRVRVQVTRNSSLPTYTYVSGRRGAVHFFVKQALLGLAPAFATKHFCYHCALVCEKQTE